MNTTMSNISAGFDPGVFLNSAHGQRFWKLCDRSLIRRAEAEAIVTAVAREVSAIKADPTADDIAAALPDRVDDDDEHGYRRRKQLALERLRRHIARLGVDPVPTESELLEQIAEDVRLGVWYDVEVLRQRPLCALYDRLLAQGLDAGMILAAGEPYGMVPRD